MFVSIADYIDARQRTNTATIKLGEEAYLTHVSWLRYFLIVILRHRCFDQIWLLLLVAFIWVPDVSLHLGTRLWLLSETAAHCSEKLKCGVRGRVVLFDGRQHHFVRSTFSLVDECKGWDMQRTDLRGMNDKTVSRMVSVRERLLRTDCASHWRFKYASSYWSSKLEHSSMTNISWVIYSGTAADDGQFLSLVYRYANWLTYIS